MTEVVAHVIPAKWKHGHGVAANFANGAGGSGGHFGTHGGADIDARAPIEGLIDQRHGGGATSAKNDSVERNAVGIFPGGIDGWALRSRRGEARVGMSGFGAGLVGDFGSPAIALPVGTFGGRDVGHTFPPDAAIGSKRDVGEDGVFGKRSHGVGIGLGGGAGSYT